MALALRQSTASQEIPLGYFVDSTDGNTEETALTIANTDIKIWKAGATTLASKNSGGATHISNGVYYTVLDATDTDTLGPLVAFVHVAGALAVRVECVVLTAVNYDSAIAGTDLPDVSVTQWLGTAATAPNTAGTPVVDLGRIAGTTVSTSSAQLGVNVVNAAGTAWTAALADSVPADGTLPSINQALYMITQFLYERSVSGTTVTVKKADGATSLLTLTLNDGTTPTSITRAT